MKYTYRLRVSIFRFSNKGTVSIILLDFEIKYEYLFIIFFKGSKCILNVFPPAANSNVNLKNKNGSRVQNFPRIDIKIFRALHNIRIPLENNFLSWRHLGTT